MSITPYIYNFETSQPLTQFQLDKLNAFIEVMLFCDADLDDIPEFTTDIELQQDVIKFEIKEV